MQVMFQRNLILKKLFRLWERNQWKLILNYVLRQKKKNYNLLVIILFINSKIFKILMHLLIILIGITNHLKGHNQYYKIKKVH